MPIDKLTSLHGKPGDDSRYAKTRELVDEFEDLLLANVANGSDRLRIESALTLMFDLHLDQKDRPDGQPYVNHTLGVALDVIKGSSAGSPDVVIAALLHDSVEDQAVKLAEASDAVGQGETVLRESALRNLENRFGRRVTELVNSLTNPEFDPMIAARRANGDTASDDDLYIELYCRHFKEILDTDPEAFLIKMADFSDNALRIGELPEGSKKTWLRKKYGPVIQMVIGELGNLSDLNHPLASNQQELMDRLTTVFARDYENGGEHRT